MIRFVLLLLTLVSAAPYDLTASVRASPLEILSPERASRVAGSVQQQPDVHGGDIAAPVMDALSIVRNQMFFAALVLGFGLLHLILYSFLPGQRSNLYYALFLLFLAGAIYFDFEHFLAVSPDGAIDLLRVQRIFLSLSVACGLRFVYALFAPVLSRHFWVLAGGLIVTGLVAMLDPTGLFLPLEILLVLALTDNVRVLIMAVRAGQADAWIVAAGFIFFAAFALYDVLLDTGAIEVVGSINNAYQYGMTGLLIATSTFLAKDIARTNARVVEQERLAQQQEAERQLLSAEVARKTQELSEARALQLSMLPRCVPALPDLEIAVHMETATEVGGDYYDFHVEPDGTLLVVIGDATGHGTKAGIMVAIAKSLFKSILPGRDLPSFFNRCTDILKPMNLGNNFMALMIVRIRDDVMDVSAAGMPPMLVYRKRTDQVEEITLKGMPLGAFRNFPFQQTSTELETGDTILLLTDGLFELFNPQREMLGMDRIGDALQEAGSETPEAIADRLRETIDRWRDGAPQADDITFVVIQKR